MSVTHNRILKCNFLGRVHAYFICCSEHNRKFFFSLKVSHILKSRWEIMVTRLQRSITWDLLSTNYVELGRKCCLGHLYTESVFRYQLVCFELSFNLCFVLSKFVSCIPITNNNRCVCFHNSFLENSSRMFGYVENNTCRHNIDI